MSDKENTKEQAQPLTEESKEEQPKAEENMVGKVAEAQKNQGSFKLLLLILMVLQNSSTVLVSRYLRASVPKDDLFIVNHLVCVTEVAKFFLSCILEYFATNGGFVKSVQENILEHPLDALKISVPALLYLVQNTLLYVAISNLAAPLFQVTYQGKLVTTAIVSVIMLQRKYSVKQWICLVVLCVGVAIVVLAEKKDKEEEPAKNKPPQSLALGLLCVTVSCVCSALAGVYFEKVLKRATQNADGKDRAPVSMWMRNMQLAFFSVVIAVMQGLGQGDQGGDPKSYLHGFSVWAWVLVGLQAGGGLLVAAVIKYADNVLKGLATGVSVVVATTFSMVFFDTPLTPQFACGAILILGSVYIFSNDIPKFLLICRRKPGEDDVEMQSILPK